MEERTKTRNSVLGYIIKAIGYVTQTSKSLFSNDETDYAVNSIDDIKSLDEYDLDAISKADRQTIENLWKIEKEVKQKNDRIKKSVEGLETQVQIKENLLKAEKKVKNKKDLTQKSTNRIAGKDEKEKL